MTTEALVAKLDADTAAFDSKIKASKANNDKFNTSVSDTDVRLGRFSRSAGQAGIQLQQFVGQVQGGQSAMLALSQQAADLGIVLGAPLVGAVVGIAASFAGALLPELFKTNDAIKDLNETSEKLFENYTKLAEAQREVAKANLIQQIEDQSKAYRELQEEIGDMEDELKLLESRSKREGAGGAIMRAVFGGDEEDVAEAQKELIEAKSSLAAMGIEIEDLVKKVGTLNQLDAGKTIEEINNALKEDFSQIGQTEGDPALLAGIIEQESINEQRLEAERRYIESVQELHAMSQETALERLNFEVEANRAALESKLIDEEKFMKAQAAAVKKFNKEKDKEAQGDKKRELEKLNTQQTAIRAGMALANLAFEDNKAINAGLVVADTAVGIQKSLAINPYDYVNVALIAATGAANLANVLSASKGGGATPTGGGGGVGAGTSDVVGGSFEPETTDLDATITSPDSVQRIVISLEDGTDLVDGIAQAISENQRQGRT